jgi:microcystin degradation protein MlrC
MKIGLAQIWQETHTFSPIITGLKEFEQGGLYLGNEIIEKMRGLGEIGGFLSAVDDHSLDIEIVPIIRAWAMSGGRITKETLHYFEAELLKGLRENLPLDGIYLSMHGAGAAENIDDFEGYLLAAVRELLGDTVPIVVSFDHHANITNLIVESVDALIGYQTQPHDPFETGYRAGNLLFSIIHNEISPVIAWQKIPMLAPADRGATSEWPMGAWFDLARDFEKKSGVVSISNFPVQPWLDVPELGWSVVVITDDDLELAEQTAGDIANKAWEMRDEFWKVRRLSPGEAIRRAVGASDGPIIVCDASDSVLSGVPGDSTCLLEEMLNQEIDCIALLPIVDSEVVEKAIAAGLDSEITVFIGGKLDKLFSKPVKIKGRVGGINSEGFEYPIGQWGSAKMGRTVILEVGTIRLLVSEFRGMGGTHPDVYRHFGIEPAGAKIIVVKTYFHYQDYSSMLKGVLMADCPGLSTWDLRQFVWKKAPRPIFPLDEISEWKAMLHGG